jgi:N-succinyldiaminopimelate aminotransferase
LNLGSGTPDMPLQDVVQAAATGAVASGQNQYAPLRGVAVLQAAIAEHAHRFYEQEIDPTTEVTVTSGVTEGIHAAIFSFLEPGDEVIVFEPFYDCYVPCIRMAGGTPVAVTLHAPRFRFDPEELRSAFSPRTKALLLNTPHNPTGTVFSKDELTLIAELCKEFDVLAVTDEVYEHVVFDGAEHVRLATLPGMWERTLTLSGAGKTLSCTGWRIGWAIGPAHLHDALARLRQFTVFGSATPLQFGVAAGLRFPDSYFHQLAADYQARRDFLADRLAACGLNPTTPSGGFFILTDISSYSWVNGREFCRDLAKRYGVVAIPTDTLYLNQHHGKRIVRFTFCPRLDVLESAAERLSKLAAARGTAC